MAPVVVQFLKNPDILHWGFEVEYLGEDRYGRWMGSPAGTRRWKGELAESPTAFPAVFCAPHDAWWHLHYNGATSNYSHFVDIVTPPVWVSHDRYEMVDLDLDVVVHQDGRIEVEDEDEFEVHQVRYSYTPEMVTKAEETTAAIVEALEGREEPFFQVAEAWLGKI